MAVVKQDKMIEGVMFVGKFVDMTGWVMSEHGVPDSRWTVVKSVGRGRWLCRCGCEKQTEKELGGSTVRSGATKSCGCYNREMASKRNLIDMTGWVMKEHGVPRSRLTAIECMGRDEDGHVLWLFECECGNKKAISGDAARGGITLSCGCLHRENIRENGKKNKKENNYDITSYDYGVGWARNSGIEFWFDLEDYELLRDHCWSTCTDHNGYTRLETQIKINGKYKRISMAQFLTKCDDIDHADQNPMNNRRNNFRVATRVQQVANQKLKSNNTTGVTGVYLVKLTNKWKAEITYNKEKICLGTYDNKNDAIVARLKAEQKYFREFAPQKHLYKQYGIIEDGSEAN